MSYPTLLSYHVIAVNDRTGKVTICTSEPLQHDKAVIVASKFNAHKGRRIQLCDSSNVPTHFPPMDR